MAIKEYDLVELKAGEFAKDGQISIVLEILTSPCLGYLVEDVDSDEKPSDYPATYPVGPEEIKRVLNEEEARRVMDERLRIAELTLKNNEY